MAISSVCPPLGSKVADIELPGVLASSSGQMGLGDTLSSRREYDTPPSLCMGKPGFRASKSFLWRTQIRQIYTKVPSSECATDLVLGMSKSTISDYHLGTAGVNSVYQDLSAGQSPADSPAVSVGR